MPEYAVIYDPALEIAAIIDTDSGQSLGPICPGPNGREQLEAFLNGTPPAFIDNSTAETLTEAFRQFWAKNYGPGATAATGDAATVGAQSRNAGDTGAALAEHEAANADYTPPPQPADTDMEAGTGAASDVTHAQVPLGGTPAQGTQLPAAGAQTSAQAASGGSGLATAEPPPVVGPCPFCNGSGTVHMADGSPDQQCNACRGTGKLPPPVTA